MDLRIPDWVVVAESLVHWDNQAVAAADSHQVEESHPVVDSRPVVDSSVHPDIEVGHTDLYFVILDI